MKRIYKYQLEITDTQTIKTPGIPKFLCAQAQGDKLFVWVEIDDSQPDFVSEVFVFGTGHPILDHPIKYLSTVQTHGGQLVWHVYVRG